MWSPSLQLGSSVNSAARGSPLTDAHYRVTARWEGMHKLKPRTEFQYTKNLDWIWTVYPNRLYYETVPPFANSRLYVECFNFSNVTLETNSDDWAIFFISNWKLLAYDVLSHCSLYSIPFPLKYVNFKLAHLIASPFFWCLISKVLFTSPPSANQMWVTSITIKETPHDIKS
jgi:hypothetical protein